MTVKRNGDRVVLKDGKVSCECCRCIEVQRILDTGFFRGFYYYFISEHNPPRDEEPFPESISFAVYNLNLILILIGQISNRQFLNNPNPGGCRQGFRMCHRFLCRKVIVEGGVIVFASNTEFGGPTTTGKRLWEDICEPEFGDETESGTYFYYIDFFGWREYYPPKFMYQSDENYVIAKYKIETIEL
jgi:hypothetical protein